ncbi:hypothetical protein EDD11_003669 [Mortierella claussenii]|nr:hypothetical protein EDD11_003669 [Mortierella claussenii]
MDITVETTIPSLLPNATLPDLDIVPDAAVEEPVSTDSTLDTRLAPEAMPTLSRPAITTSSATTTTTTTTTTSIPVVDSTTTIVPANTDIASPPTSAGDATSPPANAVITAACSLAESAVLTPSDTVESSEPASTEGATILTMTKDSDTTVVDTTPPVEIAATTPSDAVGMATATLLESASLEPSVTTTTTASVPSKSASPTTSTESALAASSPLELSELRTQITQFLDLKDALSCAVVSSAWHSDVSRQIWHTIDLSKHASFKEIDPLFIQKHGHLIRVIQHIRKRSELNLFRHDSIKNVSKLQMQMKQKRGYQHRAAELLRRNHATLRDLEIFAETSRMEFAALQDSLTATTPKTSTAATFTSDSNSNSNNPSLGGSITTPAKSFLRVLSLRDVSMTRSNLSSLLEACPHLEDLSLRSCEFSQDDKSRHPDNLFRHEGITSLLATVELIFCPDGQEREIDHLNIGNTMSGNPNSNNNNGAPAPLFIHFPNLTKWETWGQGNTLENPTPEIVKIGLDKYCPNVRHGRINDVVSVIINGLLTKAFEDLETICVHYNHITSYVILSLLYHKLTLTAFTTYKPDIKDWTYDTDCVIPVDDTCSEGWMVHLMMSSCPFLKRVELPSHEMDMDMADHFPWICTELEELRIRIKGLNTQGVIMKAINQWRRGARARRNASLRLFEVKDGKEDKAKVVIDMADALDGEGKDKDKEYEEEKEDADSFSETTTTSPGSPALPSSPASPAGSTVSVASTAVEDQGESGNTTEIDAEEDDANSTHKETEVAAADLTMKEEEEDSKTVLDDPEDVLADRVAKHLLQFENLRRVWLGYKVWTV